MKNLFRVAALVAAVLLFVQCQSNDASVRNVIFMIGDGMGMNHVFAASCCQEEPLAMYSGMNVAMQWTSSANERITDSAASGTALACGCKTNNKMIGMSADSVRQESILALAAQNGKSTGIVVTCALTHATPAAYVAHQTNRNMLEEIAEDFVRHTPDIVIGGGRRDFEKRSDKVNLSDQIREKGHEVCYTMDDLKQTASDKVFALLADGHLPLRAKRGGYLPDAVSLAIHKLNQNKKGFFLMVEGSQIDMRAHSGDTLPLIEEVLDFDKAVAVAVDFAKKDKHTLVVVTADHETGGMAVLQDKAYRENEKFKARFSTTGHTGIPVIVYSYGAGAEAYKGIIMDNSDHKALLSRLMKLK